MSFYKILLTTHSVVRWLLLISMVLSIVISLIGWINKKGLSNRDLKVNTFAMSFAHLQVIFGLVLYFITPQISFSGFSLSDPVIRYYTINHSLIMILAVIVLTVGSIRAKRAADKLSAATTSLVWYLVSLGLIISAIP